MKPKIQEQVIKITRTLMFLVCTQLLLGAGCNSATIFPLQDTVHLEHPDVSVNFQGGLPREFIFTINGRDVSTLFIESGGTALLLGGDLLSGYVREGENVLNMVSPQGTAPRTFYYDSTGPEVHITGVTQIDTDLIVSGYISDNSVPEQLLLEGMPIELSDDHRFTVTTQEREFYYFQTVDANGFERAVTYHNNSNSLPATMGIKIDNKGITEIDSFIEDAIAEADLSAWIARENPIVDRYPLRVGKLSLSVGNVEITQPHVDLVVENGKIHVTATIDQMTMDATGKLQVFLIGAPVNGPITVDNITITTTADISVGGDGNIIASLSDLSSNFKDATFVSNWDWVPIVSGIVRNIFSNIFPDTFNSALYNPIAGIVQDQLNRLDTQSTIDIAGQAVVLTANPEIAQLVDDSLIIQVGTSVEFEASNVGERNLGYRYSGESLPGVDQDSPEGIRYNTGAVLSVNMLNQLLWLAHDGGLSNITLETPASEDVTNPRLRLRYSVCPLFNE